MTYALERQCIETYFNTEWAARTALGFDGHEFTPAHDTVQLFIQSGEAFQGSIGRASNRIDHAGLVQVMVYVNSGDGSATWRSRVEGVIDTLFNKRLTSAGAVVGSGDTEFLRFSPQDQHPYIAGQERGINLTTVTVNAPFLRYGYK
jgi:hypothetical protein